MVPATLPDGTEVRIRPIEATDKAGLAAGFEALSPESRYRRFFRPMARLSEADLRYLTEVDHHDHEALIALSEDVLIGVARYIRSAEEPAYAEVAVTILDEWQSRGVATALLRRLVSRARAEGITHFLAIVLGENRDALSLFRSMAADDARPRRRDGHVELRIELPDDEVSGSPLGRALRHAAAGTIEFNPLRLLKQRLRDNRLNR